MTKAKATVNSDQGNQLPSKVVRLKELIVEICAGTNADYRDELSDSYAREFNAGAWAWDPIVEPVADGKVDRLGEVIMGPIYTCAEYAWPSKDGYPMSPLIQLDLAKASEVGSVNLGDGLIQVWMPHKAIEGKDQFIRVVPKKFVGVEKLTPVVALSDDLDPLQCRGEEWDDDADDFVQSPAYQIVGYAQKRYLIPLRSIKDNYTLKDITSDAALLGRIKEFDKLLQTTKKKGPKSIRTSNSHLFGTFSDIQYAADERPLPLFCFDGEEFGLMWGDGGNAQLFYKSDPEGNVTYSFDWSCT